MPEEVYIRYAKLIDIVEETYSKIKGKTETAQYLKVILQEAIGKLKNEWIGIEWF